MTDNSPNPSQHCIGFLNFEVLVAVIITITAACRHRWPRKCIGRTGDMLKIPSDGQFSQPFPALYWISKFRRAGGDNHNRHCRLQAWVNVSIHGDWQFSKPFPALYWISKFRGAGSDSYHCHYRLQAWVTLKCIGRAGDMLKISSDCQFSQPFPALYWGFRVVILTIITTQLQMRECIGRRWHTIVETLSSIEIQWHERNIRPLSRCRKIRISEYRLRLSAAISKPSIFLKLSPRLL